MVNRCQNCGGLLFYDIPTGQLKCESCDSYFSAEEYSAETDAEENENAQKYSVSVFTCPNCGGSVSSNEAEAIEYCLYCGSFVTLKSQIEKVNKPDYILPFSKTKEECRKAYSKMIGRKLYAPKEFRNEEFLEGFKGIYIPFWTYNFQFGPDIELDGVKETRHGDYIHKQHYTIKCHSDGQLNGINYDASSSFDDDISSRIVPFDNKKLVPFKSPYMFGLYADTADVDKDLYEEDAREIARDEAWRIVSSNSEVAEGNPTRPDKKFDEKFNLRGDSFLSMLPVWFLTWRKGDRVAYSVMNGDTGDIYSEVPVDTKRYLLFSLIFAIPIFIILNWLGTFTATSMLTFSVILSLFMMIVYNLQLEKIVRRRFHADDKGYISKNEESADAAGKVTKNMVSEVAQVTGGLLGALGIGGAIFLIVIAITAIEYIIIAAFIVALIIIIYTFYRIGKNAKILEDKTVWRDVLGLIVSLVISVLMLIADPAGDEFYYFAAMLCIAGIGLSAIFTMKRYNDLVTRPVPHFFDRKAGGES